MSADWSARLRRLLLQHSLRHGDFVLASGERSSTYLDVRVTALTAAGSIAIGELFWRAAGDIAPAATGCGGMTLGADPLITAMTVIAGQNGSEWGGVIVRKEAKGHGTEAWLEIAGTLTGSEELIAIDDVVTTAGSTIRAIEKLRDHGFTIGHALCVVDREAGGREALAEAGVTLHALFTLSDLVGG